jgi:hypothetical protein
MDKSSDSWLFSSEVTSRARARSQVKRVVGQACIQVVEGIRQTETGRDIRHRLTRIDRRVSQSQRQGLAVDVEAVADVVQPAVDGVPQRLQVWVAGQAEVARRGEAEEISERDLLAVFLALRQVAAAAGIIATGVNGSLAKRRQAAVRKGHLELHDGVSEGVPAVLEGVVRLGHLFYLSLESSPSWARTGGWQARTAGWPGGLSRESAVGSTCRRRRSGC